LPYSAGNAAMRSCGSVSRFFVHDIFIWIKRHEQRFRESQFFD
jgi:hypothetical protein